ncbi:MAG: DEAD/DEAH box helicase family protein, partial [bacterium]
MNTIKIQNDFSFFDSQDERLKEELYKRLRFRDKNYFHNRAYKMRKWDGFINFFDKDNGKFLTGLLPEVSAVLRHYKVEYEIKDNRTSTKFLYDKIDDQFLNQWLPEKTVNGDPMSPITLYDYQVDLINQVIKHKRGVVFAPTSAGKTAVMIGILKTIPPNTPTLVLQNRISLAQQNYDEIVNWGFSNVGCLWGGAVKPDIITVASVQSIGKIEKMLPKVKVLIVDEIHDMMSNLPKAVYKRLKAADVRVAVSATPFKFGGKDQVQKFSVRGFFGPVLKVKSTETGILTTSELQNRGILSTSKCIFYPIREPQIPHDIYLDAATRGIAENFEFHKIVKKLADNQSGRTLILVDRIAHGDTLHNMLPNSLWVRGQDTMETRKEVIKKLQKTKGNIVAIATHHIFNTGVNVFVHNLINAAGGKADHQIIQRMGRGLRTANDKEELNYYDFVFEINGKVAGGAGVFP